MVEHLKQLLFHVINDILTWLSRSDDNTLIGVAVVAALYLLFYYTVGVTSTRRETMSPFAHFVNVVLAPVIGSTVALLLLQGAEYWTNDTFYTLYFLRTHSESVVHSFRLSVSS